MGTVEVWAEVVQAGVMWQGLIPCDRGDLPLSTLKQ